MAEMFEKASKQKLRFESSKGQLSVEDLWDLPLTTKNGRDSLDSIAMGLYRGLKSSVDVASFVDDTAKPADTVNQLKFDIVKHIIAVRKAQLEIAAKAQATKEKKQLILQIIAEKEQGDLRSMPKDELLALINSLGGAEVE